MQYRIDKRTGNNISILGFGCMRFPVSMGRIDIEKTEQLLLESINKGINYFDTAYLYPGSEAAIGQIFKKHGIRKDIFIATKLPLLLCKSYGDFDKFLNIQLERLQTDYIDYYFMHMLTGPEQWKQLCDLGIEQWIQEKREAGIIKQIGFSFHGKQGDFITLVDTYDWDFCQIQYNYMNINYQAGVVGLKYAASKGLPVFIMEPLLGGRLATGLPNEAEAILKEADENISPAAWAFKWLWNQPEVTMLLSGMNEMFQLEDNIKTAENSLPNMLTKAEEDTIQRVIDVFTASYKVPCTGCNYCMPCPKGVNIPGCFAAYNTTYAVNRMAGMQQYFMSTGGAFGGSGSASNCIKCGKCEHHCPQSIPIRESLDTVNRRLEPFYYKAVVKTAGKFTGGKKKKQNAD